MAKPPRPSPRRPLTLEEKLGHLWGAIFVGLVVVLAATLLGKACLFPG
ncbi:MAG: hypothetical protein Kow0092_31120 [Deferrisomatales bacterium]